MVEAEALADEFDGFGQHLFLVEDAGGNAADIGTGLELDGASAGLFEEAAVLEGDGELVYHGAG